MKYKLALFIAMVTIACNKKEIEKTVIADPAEIIKPAPPAENLIVVPGISIGEIVLGNSVETIPIGKPDFSDSAMGKSWLVWYDGKTNDETRNTRWMLYTTYKNEEMKEKVISEIRVNSGEYKTETGIGTGTSFEEIKKEFPSLKEFAKYKNQRTGKDIYIYDSGSGIAFEFISYEGDYAKCTAIIVYPKNKSLNTDYILNLPERNLPGGE